MNRLIPTAVCGLVIALASTGAEAHAHLLKSLPAANASVAAPKEIDLKFSERVEPRLCGIDLTTADGKAIATKPGESSDKAGLVFLIDEVLAAGTYKVHWHAVAADTHKTEGDFSFQVK